MRVKEQSEKGGLKVNIQKNKIMTSNSITLWQIDVGKLKTVTNFIFFSSKINAEGDCSHDIKTLPPWKKSYDKPTLVQFSHSVVSDSMRPMKGNTPGLPVHHQLMESTQTHVH